jgi:hypothetical protein
MTIDTRFDTGMTNPAPRGNVGAGLLFADRRVS